MRELVLSCSNTPQKVEVLPGVETKAPRHYSYVKGVVLGIARASGTPGNARCWYLDEGRGGVYGLNLMQLNPSVNSEDEDINLVF